MGLHRGFKLITGMAITALAIKLLSGDKLQGWLKRLQNGFKRKIGGFKQ